MAPILALAVVAALAAAAFVVLRGRDDTADPSRAVAQRFADAWARGDLEAAWRLTTPRTRKEQPLTLFGDSYRQAARAATATRIRVGRGGEPQDGKVTVPVVVTTRLFGDLRGTIDLPVERTGETAAVAWTPDLRLPGLEPGERVQRRELRQPRTASVLDADGHRLSRESTAAGLAGTLAEGYATRLQGKPGAELRFGKRVIAKVELVPGRSVKTTIRPSVQAAATAALGERVGGVAVVRPRNGDVLGIAGLGIAGTQPPGSSFKIVTLAASLQAGVTEPGESFPVQTAATLSGVKLRNAGDESCGGTLTQSFAHSCNSVFAPLGVRLGARRLVRFAEAFGFNERTSIPGARKSTIPAAPDLKDDLAVGASAIGQDRDLATPLTMATVGATIAAEGVRARPRLLRDQKVRRKRVVRRGIAGEVRDMMLEVVRSGTGTAAALPGIAVAGKTGTAELVPTADAAANPENTTAWFVAYSPDDPSVAVAVMLVGAGQGGASAAPVAREVLAAVL